MKSKREMLKIQVRVEEKCLIQKLYGPRRHMSANIRRVLLDPRARRDPDQWRELTMAINGIAFRLEELLKAEKPRNAADLPKFIEACCMAIELLKALRHHAA